AGLFALVASAVVGGVAALVAHVGGEALAARFARLGSLARSPRAVSATLAGLVSALAFLGVSFRVGMWIVLDLARPDFTAAALAGANLLIALGAAGLHVLVQHGIEPGVRAVSTRSILGWLFRSVWRVAGLAFAVVATAVAAWLVRHRELLPYLPWERVAPALVAVVVGPLLAVLFLRVARRRPSTMRWAVSIVAGAWIATGAYGLLQMSDVPRGHALFEKHLGASSIGTTMVRRSTDVDGDGYSAFLGGGDCAPFDATIHPGAIDVPEDGIDQDCDGQDLTVSGLVGGWGRWDHFVPPEVPKRPPIVLITAEALAARRMHSLGYSRETTPHLDALVETGVFFENAFSFGPSTRLSFPSLFTGLWATDVERRSEGKPPYPIASDNTMLAEVLRSAGYQTASVVPAPYFTSEKWEGIDQGFERVERVPRPSRGSHVAREVNERAIEVLDGASPRKPPFLWVHHWDTHPPHRQPDEGPSFGDSPEDKYDAELRHLDAHLNDLVEAVFQRLPDAVVIITGDHGIAYDRPRHARRHYGFDLHTVTLHVPLLWLGRAFEPRRIEEPTSHLDLLPTLANLLRVDQEYRFRGESLVPELFGRHRARSQYVFHQFLLLDDEWRGKDPLRFVSVRTPAHHMILNRRNGRASLWNWENDYFERDDLAGSDDPEVRKVARTLEQLLSAFVRESSREGRRRERSRPSGRRQGTPH
ncbi:MAG: sulfatase-like hydrolase/transferase, partial [Myxococcota bacterium]